MKRESSARLVNGITGTLANVLMRQFLRYCTVPQFSSSTAGSWLERDPEYVKMFIREGKVLQVGETWFRPAYARTLQRIATEGADAVYSGEMARGIAETVQARGGVLTVEDLSGEFVGRMR
jgi:gamma-glutamyltranspeptidase